MKKLGECTKGIAAPDTPPVEELDTYILFLSRRDEQ
jgi:hypothetical protein